MTAAAPPRPTPGGPSPSIGAPMWSAAWRMALKAAGLTPHGRLNGWLTGLGCWFLSWRSRRLVAAGS